MKKLFVIAAIAAMVSCTGGQSVPVQDETDSVELVVDTLDSTMVDTLVLDTVN